MKFILENRIRNHVKAKKWLQYFLASLLILVLSMTGCGRTGGRRNIQQ